MTHEKCLKETTFPYRLLFREGGEITWKKDGFEITVQCPHGNRIRVVKKSNHWFSDNRDIDCSDKLKSLKIEKGLFGCKYHRKNKEYVLNGLCSDASYLMYPYLFALLYKSRKNEYIINCPHNTFKIERKPKKFKNFYIIINNLFRFFDYPKDLLGDKVLITVEKTDGKCKKKYEVNETFTEGEAFSDICPALFYSAYINDKDKGICPDINGNIRYTVRK